MGGLVCIFDQEKFGPVIDQANGIHSYTKYKDSPINNHGISTCGCYSKTHKLSDVVRNGLKGQYEHNEKHAHLDAHLWQVYWQKTYLNPLSLTGIETGTTKDAYYQPTMTSGKGQVHGGTHAATAYMIKLMKGLGGHRDETYKVQKEESHREGVLMKKVVTQEKKMYSTQAFRQYTLPNIISYDFVNEATNKHIIDLNKPSIQLVPEGQEEF